MTEVQPVHTLRLRKRLAALINTLSRTARVGNYWYWLDVPELADGVTIAALISPLRYDVLIRRDFLAWYADHRDLYAADFAAFVELARQHDYYHWFMTSEAVRCKQSLLADARALEQAFQQRVRRAAQVYENISRDGFRAEFPIILKTAEHLLPPTTDPQGPPTGKLLSRRYFLADGCHRLAMLLLLGYTTVPASYLRVKCFRVFSPFDSTHVLTRSLTIDPKRYFAFLSGGYCQPSIYDNKADFLNDIITKRPEVLAEVHSILRADGFDTAAV